MTPRSIRRENAPSQPNRRTGWIRIASKGNPPRPANRGTAEDPIRPRLQGDGADGVVEDIAYSIDIDESGDRAAVHERAKREYARLHEGVATIDAPFEYEGMLAPEALPDDFCEQFLAAPPDERAETTVYSRYERQDSGDTRANVSVTYFDTGYGGNVDWQIRVMVD